MRDATPAEAERAAEFEAAIAWITGQGVARARLNYLTPADVINLHRAARAAARDRAVVVGVLAGVTGLVVGWGLGRALEGGP
jgi:hypothetical protein